MILAPQAIVRPEGAVFLTLEADIEDGVRVCGIYGITGRIRMRPKAWLAAVTRELAAIERIAKAQGCEEVRFGGRNWSAVARRMGYEPFPEIENGWRKRI